MAENKSTSIQEHYAPKSICFGCGPANAKGLRIRSFPIENGAVAEFMPELHHPAFPNVISGGIIGTLLDCHSNWTAAFHIMKHRAEIEPPCTVTAEYAVKLRRPTPIGVSLKLVSKIEEIDGDKAKVSAELWAKEILYATCSGIFVAVKPGHPAYHRWDPES